MLLELKMQPRLYLVPVYRAHYPSVKSEFHMVGAALSPHPTYRYCCVMDFAGTVVALAAVLSADYCSTYHSVAEIEADPNAAKLFNSIPYSLIRKDNTQNLRQVLIDAFTDGCVNITINFQHARSTATIDFVKKEGVKILTRTQTLSWGVHSE